MRFGNTPMICFPKVGLGEFYSETFARAVGDNWGSFPHVPRGQTLLMAADFGGENKGQAFQTFAFLFFDVESNQAWLRAQPAFRAQHKLGKRRMGFKSLNDGFRRKALVPFLKQAELIEGILVVFAVSSGKSSLFEISNEGADLLNFWKPHVQEKLMRVLHLSALFCSALSVPNQDLMWFIDEDAIAANDKLLLELTNIFARVSSNYLPHELRNLSCGSSKSDNGDLQIEDIISISDLAAGALAEIATRMNAEQLFPRKGIITPLTSSLTWKSRLIGSWLAAPGIKLKRNLFFLEILGKGSRLSHLGFRQTSLIHMASNKGDHS